MARQPVPETKLSLLSMYSSQKEPGEQGMGSADKAVGTRKFDQLSFTPSVTYSEFSSWHCYKFMLGLATSNVKVGELKH